MFILPSIENKNLMNVYPHINKINQDVIDYILDRTNETNNPILVARYINVAIDFTDKLSLNKVNFRFIKKYFDSIFEINKEELITDDYYLMKELERAVFIARKYNNQEYFNKLKDIIIYNETNKN